MTWTADNTRDIGRALLGSWPGTVNAWGREGIAAYLAELEARGLTAEQTLLAIRTWPAGSDFPPSAPNLAARALEDPSVPTFPEAMRLVRHALRAFNLPLKGDFSTEAQMLGARNQRVLERAEGLHPLVASFVDRMGVERLQREVGEMGDDEFGSLRRRDLERAWREQCEAMRGRERVLLVSGRSGRGSLASVDPLAAIGVGRRALEAGNQPTKGAA